MEEDESANVSQKVTEEKVTGDHENVELKGIKAITEHPSILRRGCSNPSFFGNSIEIRCFDTKIR